MKRYCFQLQVHPERIAEYRERHAAVWPEMLRALEASGWRNYSLFMREDGLLIGYFESDFSLEKLQRAMSETEVNARWQAEMAEFFVSLDGAPDTGFTELSEVFNLEAQLAALTPEPDAAARSTHSASPGSPEPGTSQKAPTP